MTISSCYDCYWSTTIKHARTQAHHSKVEYVSLVIFHLENLIQAVKGPNTLGLIFTVGAVQTSSTVNKNQQNDLHPVYLHH